MSNKRKRINVITQLCERKTRNGKYSFEEFRHMYINCSLPQYWQCKVCNKVHPTKQGDCKTLATARNAFFANAA